MMYKLNFLKSLIASFMLFCLFFGSVLTVNPLKAQDDNYDDEYYDEYEDEYEDEDDSKLKMLFGNLGYSDYGWYGGAGFRYWVFGVSVGIGALGHDSKAFIKNYQRYPKKEELDPFSKESYTTLIVDGNFYYFVDLSPKFSAFGSLGFYAQTDTVLISKYYEPGLPRETYFHETQNKWGLSFGIGGQYFYDNSFTIGAGYHTKNGFFAQIGYYWK